MTNSVTPESANTNEKQTFVVVGRVTDNDDILCFLDATDSADAKKQFLPIVKSKHDWDGQDDIYIEFCISLSEYTKGKVYDNTMTNTIYCNS